MEGVFHVKQRDRDEIDFVRMSVFVKALHFSRGGVDGVANVISRGALLRGFAPLGY